MKANFIIPTILFLLWCSTVKAQENNLADAYNTYQQNNLHEKLFVHTDKATYLAGEILWFKIYYVNADGNKPLNISKVAYVDVLDKNQVPVLQAKIALGNGAGVGSLYLPVNLNTGNYKLRAYTNWMKNYGPGFFFEKQVSVINPLRSPEDSKAIASADYDIQFLPEGGSIINGAENKVAFRMADRNGKGVSFDGAVIDQKNDTIIRFKPLRYGLGNLKFIPKSGSSYRAVIKTPGKNTYIPFSMATTNGYGMVVTENAGKINIRVNSTADNGPLYLVTYATGIVNVAQTAYLSNNSVTFVVDKDKLSAGVNHFTVFNAAKQPVSERLYFVRSAKKLDLNFSFIQPVYNTRKKVEIDLNSAVDNQPAKAMLSMAVYKIDSLQKADDVNIQNYLWLTSELKGNIESPGYYFANAGIETNLALDNLMLTQGWRKFDWSATLTNKQPYLKFLPEYDGHIITARITDGATNTAEAGKIAYLGITSKRVQMYPAISDTSGKLLFNTRDMYGPSELVVQTNPDQDTTSRIDVLTPFAEQYSSITYPSLFLTDAAKNQLKDYNLGMQLQNIYLATKIRQFYEPVVDSAAFYFKPYKTYKLNDYTRFVTMEEVLREYVTEVNLFKSKNRFHLRTLGESGIVGDDPLVMVDGVPVFNANNLLAVDPLKIEKLDVVRSRYFYGPTSNEGIFSFTSYKGNLGGLEINPHAVVLDYEGMQLQRKFYSPLYETPEESVSRIPDFRNVLYWLPIADTDKSGKNRFTFYTGDKTGKYICIIQGITANGEVGYTSTTFDVK